MIIESVRGGELQGSVGKLRMRWRNVALAAEFHVDINTYHSSRVVTSCPSPTICSSPSRDVRRRSILPAPIGLHGLLGGTGITLRPSALTLVLFASRKLELALKYSISLDDMSLGTLSAWTFLKRNPIGRPVEVPTL